MSEPQIQELNAWIESNPDVREAKRALAVKMILSGWSYQKVSDLLQVSHGFIGKWKKRYKSQGIEGLKLAYQGKKSYLTNEQRQETIDWLKQQEFWDISELQCYLIDQFEVVFKSLASYYSLLNEARISWQKAQKKNPRKNPEGIKKRLEEIQNILKVVQPEIEKRKLVVYAIDEVHLLEGDLISHLWGSSEARLNLEISNEKNRQTYSGALNLCEPEFILEKYPVGNGESTVDFVRKLLLSNSGCRLMLFWDGASYHKGQFMKQFLQEVNQGLERQNWKVTCHLFPPYAPEENPVEAVWLQFKNLLRRCYRFCQNFSIIKRLFEMFANYKLFNFPNLKKYEAFSHLI